MQVANKYGEGMSKNSWFKAVFLGLVWLLIFSLMRDLWQIKSGFGRITDSQERLIQEEKKNAELKKKYDLVQTDEYKERLIREKLNMQKEGEVLAVLPGLLQKSEGMTNGQKEPENQQNWQKWLDILY
jgi:hypothetical protein